MCTVAVAVAGQSPDLCQVTPAVRLMLGAGLILASRCGGLCQPSARNPLYVPQWSAHCVPYLSACHSPSCRGTLREKQPDVATSPGYSWLLPVPGPWTASSVHFYWHVSVFSCCLLMVGWVRSWGLIPAPATTTETAQVPRSTLISSPAEGSADLPLLPCSTRLLTSLSWHPSPRLLVWGLTVPLTLSPVPLLQPLTLCSMCFLSAANHSVWVFDPGSQSVSFNWGI